MQFWRGGIARDLLFLVCLSAVILVIGASSIREKSPVWDEPYYVGAGYYMLRQWDKPWINYTSLVPIITHPPLPYYVNSIPFYIYDLIGDFSDGGLFDTNESELVTYPPPSVDEILDLKRDYPEKFGQRFIYSDEYEEYDLLFYSRCSMLLLLILCSTYMFVIAKRYYGFETACVITALFSLNPSILAHARLATTDIAPACFNLISFYYFTLFMERKSLTRGLAVGITLGLALLSKESSTYLLALYSAIVFIRLVSWFVSRVVHVVKTCCGLMSDKNRMSESIASMLTWSRFRGSLPLLGLITLISLTGVSVYHGGEKSTIVYVVVITLFMIFYSEGRKRAFIGFVRWFFRLLRSLTPYAMIVVLATTTLNAGYLFTEINYDWLENWGGILLKDVRFSQDEMMDRSIRGYALGLRLPVSDYYLYTIMNTRVHMRVGHPSYIKDVIISSREVGEMKPGFVEDEMLKIREGVSVKKRMDYWVTLFLIKAPEGLLILLLFSIFYFFSNQFKRGIVNDKLTWFRTCLVLNIITACMMILASTILIGVRLVLFIFPLLYLLLAEPMKALLSGGRTSRRLAYIIIALSVLPAVIYHPHYIPYFNQLVGGPENGYTYASDSNVDWGQDLPGLKEYMDEKGIDEIKLAYFGTARIDEYGIEYFSLPNNQGIEMFSGQRSPDVECGPVEGILAVSATSLTGQFGDPGCYEWLRGYEPMDNIGYSILVYNITNATAG
ncbi:MAG: phospholipid carrier-dependent glycosyltransferase [Candidatus Altiarchaeota archaeon]